jgi:hypothetical protein
MIKLSIYDEDLNQETYSEFPRDNWLGLLESVNKLRKIAQDRSINGWINEYDLTWSSVECVNKHDLEG